jgi:opacity protein-like surface antigen
MSTMFISILGGVSLPQGNFGNIVDPGFCGTIAFEYRITPQISALAAYTHHQFNAKLALASDIAVNQISVQAKYYVPTSLPFDVFAHAGGSSYAFNPGTSKVGFNVGIGAQYGISSSFGLIATYNFNSISSSGTTTTFSSVQGGIYFGF